jgi:hypothetical protein
MESPIRYLTIVRYYRDNRPWDTERVKTPSWSSVEQAIRQMDNYCFPIVQLTCTEDDDSNGFEEDSFNVIGGHGRWALFHIMGEWEYEDPNGGTEDVRLWESDQGYFCQESNVLTDVEKVLRITKAFYDSGSYDGLDQID